MRTNLHVLTHAIAPFLPRKNKIENRRASHRNLLRHCTALHCTGQMRVPTCSVHLFCARNTRCLLLISALQNLGVLKFNSLIL